MADADVVITGTALTVDDARPTAEALAVAGGRISAVGTRSEEPLRNISVAVTRTATSGRVLGPEERLTVEQAIRAQTIDAAWHLFADDVVGSLEVGKYAGMVVLSADARTVPPEQIADLDVCAAYLAGRQVYPQ
jgi:predicted amidohydrolase YtcJ